jgi:hypothetical protein
LFDALTNDSGNISLIFPPMSVPLSSLGREAGVKVSLLALNVSGLDTVTGLNLSPSDKDNFTLELNVSMARLSGSIDLQLASAAATTAGEQGGGTQGQDAGGFVTRSRLSFSLLDFTAAAQVTLAVDAGYFKRQGLHAGQLHDPTCLLNAVKAANFTQLAVQGECQALQVTGLDPGTHGLEQLLSGVASLWAVGYSTATNALTASLLDKLRPALNAKLADAIQKQPPLHQA